MATFLTKNEEALNNLYPQLLKTQEEVFKLRGERLEHLKRGEAIEANNYTPQIKELEFRFETLNEKIWRIFDKDENLFNLYKKYKKFMEEAREEGRKPYESYF